MEINLKYKGSDIYIDVMYVSWIQNTVNKIYLKLELNKY